MRIPRVYSEQSLAPGADIALEAGPSQHLSRALRLGQGAAVQVFDGRGREYRASIRAVDRKCVRLHLEAPVENHLESPLHIQLGIGISRGERFDWVVQKATELGVSAISPLYTERVEVKLKGERELRKQRHWQQVAIAACEQCGRNRLPVLHEPQLLGDWLRDAAGERRFVLHHRSETRLSGGSVPASISLLVGPEGGLTEAEIALALDSGFEALALGPRVLRTETAPVAALAILQARWGDMGMQPGD